MEPLLWPPAALSASRPLRRGGGLMTLALGGALAFFLLEGALLLSVTPGDGSAEEGRGQPPGRLLLEEAAAEGAGPPHQDLLDRGSCSRMLWLSGLQALTANGSEARYIGSSTTYLRFYAAALKSARRNAPGLLPVLVFLNEPPVGYLEWAVAQGALVVRHSLSFHHRQRMAVERDRNSPRLAQLDHLAASYARWDIPAIMPKVRAALAQCGQLGEVDLGYVLWTDPDVLFERNIDSCTLARPRLLSIGAEMIPGSPENCGVVHFNVPAYASTQAAFLDYADAHGWDFEHDQALFRAFYKRWMVNELPNSLNYKPYWGEAEYGRPARVFTEQSLTEVVIIHTHGPKPAAALCVVDFIQARNVPVQQDRDAILAHSAEVLERCGLQGAPWPEMLLQFIASGVAADGGRLYRRVYWLQEGLCPGACWAGGAAGIAAAAAAAAAAAGAQEA